MKTYRIWFKNNTAILVNARNQADAQVQAIELAIKQNGPVPPYEGNFALALLTNVELRRYQDSIKIRWVEKL